VRSSASGANVGTSLVASQIEGSAPSCGVVIGSPGLGVSWRSSQNPCYCRLHTAVVTAAVVGTAVVIRRRL
jgi:hypothetical protein